MTPTPRRIIQIAVNYDTGTEDREGQDTLFALCDDSSVWQRVWIKGKEGWERIADIPQDG